jgi:flagellar biosynthetic protein FlhB
MAEDSDLERTEPASPRRIQQAREKGQVPRSRELSAFVVLLAGGASLMLLGPHLMGGLTSLMRHGLSLDRSAAFDPIHMLARFQQAAVDVLITFLPFLLVMVVAALAAPLVLSGWLFSFQALQPDFGRLNPLKGLGRILSAQSLVELVKAVLKSLLIGGVAAWLIRLNSDAMLALPSQSVELGVAHMADLVGTTFFAVVGSMILIVAIDVPFQLWDYSNKLKMTKEELRQEHKETEGDPHVKMRIRRMQQEMARRRMMAEVPKADVIVTNPTHFAVALRYQKDSMRAPVVVAKGSALLAQKIRELGQEHRVPILEAPPLARALYRHTDLGEEIPAALYTAVAEVLAYVYQLRAYESGGGAMPQVPENLPVPPELDPENQVE